MVLKIDRVSDGRSVTLRLSGRLRSEELEQLKTELEGESEGLVLNLAELKLVDRDAICFLGECEASGIQLEQCHRYVRDWIDRERDRQH